MPDTQHSTRTLPIIMALITASGLVWALPFVPTPAKWILFVFVLALVGARFYKAYFSSGE